jgi:succinate dehydrogenase / fumarate reductase, membrane anchor subunit
MPDIEKSLNVDILRSQLGRVRGLGAARAGSGTWWLERLTSIALIPLSLWFIASAISLEGATRADVVAWLHEPVSLVLMLCLIVATFWHMEMGLRAVVEDYVHHEIARVASLLIIRGLSIVLALFCLIAALRLGL